MAGRRAVLIVNPRAGRGRALAALPEVTAALTGAGYAVESRLTASPGGATSLAAAAVGADAVVALGGDGTTSEVVNGVLGRGPWPAELALVALPLGTGNSFVRHFGPLPGDWRGALNGLLEGRATWIDAGQVTWGENGARRSRVFVNVFGAGFMAQVADVTNRRLKALGGRGYIAGVFWELARLAAPDTRLVLAGAEDRDASEGLTLVSVCNTGWTGENMWIAPRADASDGQLDVVTVGPISRLELARVFPRIFDGSHVTHPAVRTYRASRVRLEPARPGPLLLDGDVTGTTPVEVQVLPAAVRLAI
ncbi:MAG TPA: diacylglycerol kinase family protein [Chloroflexota bacterium]|nr:diacylglycerol kinase family protein [Chloroflexota bacterium]